MKALAPWRPPLAACLLLAPPSLAGVERDENELMARFFGKVCNFVDWPKGSGPQDPGQPFVIGILGGPPMSNKSPWEDPLVQALRDVFRNTPIKAHKAQFKAITSLDEVKGCHAVYLMPEARVHVRGAVKLLKPLHVMVFGHSEGFAELGVHLNFKVEDHRVRFEINEASFHDSGLKLDALILRTAIVVKRKEGKP